jgi:hypothetical protein
MDPRLTADAPHVVEQRGMPRARGFPALRANGERGILVGGGSCGPLGQWSRSGNHRALDGDSLRGLWQLSQPGFARLICGAWRTSVHSVSRNPMVALIATRTFTGHGARFDRAAPHPSFCLVWQGGAQCSARRAQKQCTREWVQAATHSMRRIHPHQRDLQVEPRSSWGRPRGTALPCHALAWLALACPGRRSICPLIPTSGAHCSDLGPPGASLATPP